MKLALFLSSVFFIVGTSTNAFAYRANASAFQGWHRGTKCYSEYQRCLGHASDSVCKARYDQAVAAGGIWPAVGWTQNHYCFLN